MARWHSGFMIEASAMLSGCASLAHATDLPQLGKSSTRAVIARFRSVLPAVFLASWNEHLKGSAVEWTDVHGYSYLIVASRVLRGRRPANRDD